MSPIVFPPLPPTSNLLSSQQRSALVRSSKKLSKVLGDVPRMLDNNVPPLPELTRTLTPTSTESTWRKRKPTHLPPLLKPSNASIDTLDSPTSLASPGYHIPATRRGSVLSIAPSIVSNAPSTASGSSISDASADTAQRRAKLERLRRKLGDEVPATALFPTTPRTAVPAPVPRTPRTSIPTTPRARTRSIAFSISSDESVHTVSFTAARVRSPHPHKSKHVYQTGPLPPVPPLPAHLVSAASSSSHRDDDDAGLIRPRQKVAAGSKIGGSDFKAARRAKRAGRPQNGMAEPGELVEMVGFLF